MSARISETLFVGESDVGDTKGVAWLSTADRRFTVRLAGSGERAQALQSLVAAGSVRITIGPAAAPAPTPLRPAEEIAREMVGETRHSQSRGWTAPVCGFELQMAPSTADRIRSDIESLIERSRAEGAAAERERLSQRLIQAASAAPPAEALAAAAIDVLRAHIPDPWVDDAFAELSRRFQEMTAQPRDLAGRIRALIQEYAGRWADAGNEDDLANLRTVMDHLRRALRVSSKGFDVERCLRERIEKMRDDSYGAEDPVSQAADEIEAIIREHGKEGAR